MALLLMRTGKGKVWKAALRASYFKPRHIGAFRSICRLTANAAISIANSIYMSTGHTYEQCGMGHSILMRFVAFGKGRDRVQVCSRSWFQVSWLDLFKIINSQPLWPKVLKWQVIQKPSLIDPGQPLSVQKRRFFSPWTEGLRCCLICSHVCDGDQKLGLVGNTIFKHTHKSSGFLLSSSDRQFLDPGDCEPTLSHQKQRACFHFIGLPTASAECKYSPLLLVQQLILPSLS